MPTGPCDPRGVGISPAIQTLWNKYLPTPNDPLSGDPTTLRGSFDHPRSFDREFLRRPHRSRFRGELEADASYRDAQIVSLSTNQVDIGGFFPGDTLGQPAATAPRPQRPSLFVVGVTGNQKPNLIADFRYSYQREYWQYFDKTPRHSYPA